MRIRTILLLAALMTSLAGNLVAMIERATDKPTPPRKNLACAQAHQLNLENPEYLELVTGWGFTPDTCSIQAATMQGTVRVPTQVVFCAVGPGVPECKTLFDLRVKK